ncbi:MAG TPA: alpha/beta hydrolase fold domain-containing protein, partial [Pirellulales bacterium]|nr:alpha/beta hydrolase fold domain-containing protein [Pirellulales bacterium]
WWAGAFDAQGNRLGQATRLGYIVVAVDWLKEGQKEYEFSAREHAAVLVSLRDACRRFSIDTDRVFLSGHSAGGNAAWDLGLAHPDLWAGVIPIVARSEKYCARYWKNAELVPFYVLGGEMDGDNTFHNATDLDRYLNGRFDITVTEYIGRGHEDFYEDIRHIFDWMSHRESRNFFPKKFSVSTMRSWDNYFWWIEAHKLPERGIVEPEHWPPERGVLPVEITGSVLATNGVAVKSGAGKVTVWLAPEIVDFNRPMKVTLNGNSIQKGSRVEADLGVLVEDVRTRADRQHPFWAKVGQ